MKKKLLLLPLTFSPLMVISCSSNEVPEDEVGDENPGTENPETENPGTENPETENPETEKPETENPGDEETTPDNPVTSNGFNIINSNGSLAIIEESLNIDNVQITNLLNSVNHGLFDYASYRPEDDTNTDTIKIANAANNLTNKTNPSFTGNETKFLAVFNTKSEIVYRYGYITKDEFTFNSLFWSDNLSKVSDYMIWQEPISLWGSDSASNFNGIQWTQVIETSSSLTDEMKSYLNNDLPNEIINIANAL